MARSGSFDFSGADVLVVGASRAGIGAAIARAFQDAGAIVAITGAEPEPAEEDRARFAYTQLDVTDLAAVRALCRRTLKSSTFWSTAPPSPRAARRWSRRSFEHVVDVNLHGTFRTAEAFHHAAEGAARAC